MVSCVPGSVGPTVNREVRKGVHNENPRVNEVQSDLTHVMNLVVRRDLERERTYIDYVRRSESNLKRRKSFCNVRRECSGLNHF